MEYNQRIFIVFDTEGTGLEKRPLVSKCKPKAADVRGSEVCQIGGIICNEQQIPLQLFCYYCDVVAAASSQDAYNVHGIDQRQVRGHLCGEYLPEILTTFLPEFFLNDVIFVGYNVEFDMTLVDQTLENSPGSFTWRKCNGPIVPKHGRYSVDVGEYFKVNGHFRKLATFVQGLEKDRKEFLDSVGRVLSVRTNCLDMLQSSWKQEHNALFDAINTYLLWRDCVWRKKLY